MRQRERRNELEKRESKEEGEREGEVDKMYNVKMRQREKGK